MGNADRAVGGVDVLPAGAGRAIGVEADVLLINLDLDGVVDGRIDPHRRKTRMAARIGIERRDANQPVHARLGLEPAIGVEALDEDRGRLNARLFPIVLADQLDLIAPPFSPAHIHALQHLSPVLALGATGAGVDFDVSVVAVGLT